MKAKLRKAFATILTVSMMMSMLSVSAFATDSVVTDDLAGTTTTTTTTTTTETTPSEDGNITVVVKVDTEKVTETETGEVLSTVTKETVTEKVTDPETGEAVIDPVTGLPKTEKVVSETVTKTDYTVETDLTDMPEVSAGLDDSVEFTDGNASSTETNVEVVEGEGGTQLEIETTTTNRKLTVETENIETNENKLLESEIEQGETPEEQPVHGQLDSIVDAEGNEVAAEKVVDDADALNKVQNIAQNGYMSSASDLDALKEQIKANNSAATDDVLAGLTEEKALEITQAALTSAANGTVIESYTGAEKMLYDYLMKASEQAPEQVIEVKEDSLNLVIGDKIGEKTVDDGAPTDIYEGALNFSLTVVPTENDDLLVCLQYVDADGATQTVTKRLAGQNGEGQSYETITAAEDGSYTIGGLKLSENENLKFDLKLEGLQNLEDSLYIYSDGTEDSTKQVAVGDVTREVNTTTSVSFRFKVEHTKNVDISLFSESDDISGKKTATKQEDGTFEVEVFVPGADGENKHDEVILMVDGSYSMDNEWPAMKEAINTIGRTVLNGSGNTQLTLMAFGMGDNEVLVHIKDADELAAALGELPGNLLYGRSSTNCEAGFTGVANYIKNHDETLNEVQVIFISDGNINTDETPRAFDANWQTWTKYGALTVAQETFGGTVTYGETFPAAFTTVFGNRFDGATREEIVTRAFGGEVTEEEFYAFAEQVWTDVYAYSGLERGTAYPISDAERAFVKYDKENGTYIQDLFYYTTYKSAYVTYGDRWTRTPAAANALAAMDEVKAMYVVDYDGYTSWMDTGITNAKSTFVQSNGIAGLCEALKDALTDLAKTPVEDVVVTDYMSKWVNLDQSTIRIVDNSTKKVIWTVTDGWLITENIPTEKNPPVVVELVDPSDYSNGGDDVVGNENGNIYKLTWYVKDGPLYRADTYSLRYNVTIDTDETGYVAGEEYPANGRTYICFKETKDKDSKQYFSPIEVPNVSMDDNDGGNPPSGGGNPPSGGGNPPSGGGNPPSGGETPPSGEVNPPEDIIEIPDEDTPLVDIPDEDIPLVDIPEDDIPLADVPKTGDASALWMALSAISGAGLFLTRKKREDD